MASGSHTDAPRTDGWLPVGKAGVTRVRVISHKAQTLLVECRLRRNLKRFDAGAAHEAILWALALDESEVTVDSATKSWTDRSGVEIVHIAYRLRAAGAWPPGNAGEGSHGTGAREIAAWPEPCEDSSWFF